MKLFGFEITRTTKAPVPATTVPTGWLNNFGAPFWGGAGNSWFPIVQEPFTGAWQRNQELTANTLLSFHALYRCITMISQDISKLRVCLVEQLPNGIWQEVERNSPYWPVLIKPNRYQTRIQFFDEWMTSKLVNGNTYVLKERDARGIVVALYILNPWLTKPLVAPDGSVYYEVCHNDLYNLNLDYLLEDNRVRIPASEIIHDRYNPLYHPLCGISPIMACALSGALGISIAMNSAKFFKNQSQPGGVLSAPEHIEDDTAARLKAHFENNYSGENAGRIAVLGDGLKFEVMRENAVDAQLIEQLKLSGENVCTAFGVPAYKIGIGTMPAYNNVEALDQQYYSQCLQILIESIELLLDEGLGLTAVTQHIYGTEFDLTQLLRMDTSTKSKTWGDLVKQGIAAPNEARAAFDLMPVDGGDSVYMQQQNYSLEALAKRDEGSDPFGKPAPASPSSGNSGDGQQQQQTEDGSSNVQDITAAIAARLTKHAFRATRRLST